MKVHLKVTREDAELDVYILKNKSDGTFSFVNITKGHICPCKFDTLNDAMEDLREYVRKGKVLKYEIIK